MGAFFENFFKVNWITLLVGGLILAGLIVLQNKSDFISKHLQVKPMRFYITVLLFVLFIIVVPPVSSLPPFSLYNHSIRFSMQTVPCISRRGV